MNHRRTLTRTAAALLFAAVLLAPSPRARATGIPVIDVANLAENVVSAVQSTLEVLQQVEQLTNEARMIVNQIQQIQHLVEMLRDMDLNSLAGLTGTWTELELLTEAVADALEVGRAIPYTLADLDRQFQERFPGYTPPIDWNLDSERRSQTVLDTLRGTLSSVGANLRDVVAVQTALRSLRSAHHGTQGRLQALMLANELASFQIGEMAKLRQLVAAQVNAQNTYLASREAKEAAGEAAVERWIASGRRAVPLSAPDPGLAAVPRP